ncbi:MAG: hypothetical protein O3A85_14175 [Proteobacteria bacterium]|nr:hypothetical protein [Pseudomonadota bacterium]
MWWWIISGWLASASMVVVVERKRARSGDGLWSEDDRAISVIAYGIVILLAPVAILIISGMTVWDFLTTKPVDPFTGPEEEWIDQEPDSFVVDLVRLRQTCDPRLKGENIGSWIMREFWYTPEAMILDVVTKYAALHAAGLADTLIWERLEAHRREKGEGVLPSPCDLDSYVDYRLGLEDAGYLDLGKDFVRGQIALCERFNLHRSQKQKDAAWPPLEWLGRQLSLTEIEPLGEGLDANAAGSPAVLSRGGGRVRSDIKDLKLLILPGDELWTFSSPQEHWTNLVGRGGIVLMRQDRPVAHVVTQMN